MSTYDAGAIQASLSVDTAKAKADLDKIKAEVKELEKDHRIKITAVFDSGSLSKARKMFADLDNMLSRDAISRLRSSPQGSVLGALDALFSPHPLTGAPSAQQAASGGLLGRMVSDQGGGGGVSAASGSSQGSSSAQNTVRDVLTGKQPGNVTTTDTISQKVTGTGPGNTETTDTVKEKVDEQSREEVIQDSKDTGDKAGEGFSGTFGSRVDDMLRDFRTKMGSAGNDGGADIGKGVLGGIGPGIAGVGAKMGLMVTGVGTALATLPAIAGIAGLGIGVAMIGGAVAEVIKGSPELTAQFKKIGTGASDVLKQAAAPLIPALHAALAQIPGMIRSVEPELAGLFKVIAPQVGGIVSGLGPIIKGLVSVMSAAAPAFGAFIGGVEKLVSNILPGLATVIRATVPFVSQFGGILATLGKNLGGLFSAAAPAVGASMKVLGSLLDLVGSLLPVLVKLGGLFADALAPAITTFAGVVRSLTPFLTTVGGILASLAGAVLGDLSSAFGALATFLTDIAPSLNTFAKTLGLVFTTLENSGVFAILGDALEDLAAPLAAFVAALVDGLAPILPPVFTAIGQIAGILAGGLASAVAAVLPPLTTLATTVLSAIADVLPVILPLLTDLAGIFTVALVAVVKGVADALSDVIAFLPPDVLKAIALALAGIVVSVKALALGRAAFAGLSAMVTSLQKLFGMGEAGGGAAEEAATGMQDAGDTMTEAAAAMQRAADTMAGAAGKEGAAGDAEGAEGGAAAAGGGEAAAGGEEAAEAAGGIGIAGAAAGLALVLAPLAIGAVIAGVIKATNGNQLAPFVAALVNSSAAKFQQANTTSAQKQMASAISQITDAFNGEEKGASAASGALDDYTAAVQANGVKSAQAQAARSQLITDLISAGVNSVKALEDVQDYNEAIAQNGVSSAQAQAARQQLITDIISTSSNASQGRQDLNNFSLAVQDDGAKSSAAQAARTQLIDDLEKSGLNAQTATGLVDGLATAIGKLHGANITITMKGDGTYTITEVGNQSQGTAEALEQGGGRLVQATGGYISQGTTGTADDVPAWLSKGEYVMQASSVARYGTPMMDAINAGKYASGGAVDGGNLTPGYIAGMASTFQSQATAAMVAAMKASMAAAVKAAAAAASAAAMASTAGISNASGLAALTAAAKAHGWTGAQLQALLGVEAREDASMSLTAQNPTSSAYGMAQFIGGASEYATYGGNSTTYAGQATAMANYIAQRYGTPEAALAHEQAYGWYASGGPVSPWPWTQPGGGSGAPWMQPGGSGAPWQQQGGPWPWMPYTGGQGLPALMQAVTGDAGGLGLTRADLGLPATIPTASTDTSSGTDTSSDASATTTAPAAATTSTAPAAMVLNAAEKAAVAVLESLMGGLIWHNRLGEANQANRLLGTAGVTKYDAQLSQISFLDSLLGKAKTKAAKLSAEHLLATFGVHVFTPDLTAKGNAPQAAVIAKMKSLVKGDITANSLTAAGQANAILTSLGVGTYTSELGTIGHLDSLLASYRKSKNTGAVTATETLLRQLGVRHFAAGGVIPEPVTGFGQQSGQIYQFGEHGPETVTPGAQPGGSDMGAKLDRNNALMEQLIAVTGSLPHGITGGIGTALSGAAQSASFRSRYPRGGS